MKSKLQRHWLYDTGLLETLSFHHRQNICWYQCIQNKRFVYSIHFSEDNLPSFKRCEDPI